MDQIDPAELADVTIVHGDERPAPTNYFGDRRGDSGIIDQFDKDLAERQAQVSVNHMSDSDEKVLVNYLNAGEDDSVVQLNQDKL